MLQAIETFMMHKMTINNDIYDVVSTHLLARILFWEMKQKFTQLLRIVNNMAIKVSIIASNST